MDISLDSCVKDTYEKIRRGARHSETMSNIRKLVAIRDAHKINRFKIYANFVIQAANCGEIKDFVTDRASSGLIPNFSLVLGSDELSDHATSVSSGIANALDEASRLCDEEAVLRLKFIARLWPSYLHGIRRAKKKDHFRNETIIGRTAFGILRNVRELASRIRNGSGGRGDGRRDSRPIRKRAA